MKTINLDDFDIEFVLDTSSDSPRTIAMCRVDVAAEIRGVSIVTLNAWVRSGQIPAPREIDGIRGWPAFEVTAWAVVVEGGAA